MLQSGSSEILSLIIVVFIYVDLVATRSITELFRDRVFRHVTAVSIVSIFIGFIVTLLLQLEVITTPVVLRESLRIVHIFSFPFMVFLWSLFIIISLDITKARYNRIKRIGYLFLAVCALLLIGEQIIPAQLTGISLAACTICCLAYSCMIFFIILPTYPKNPKDTFFPMIIFPIMYSLSVLIFYFRESHKTFTISQALTVFAVFLIVQNRRLRFDSLTGLPTMRSFLGDLDRAFNRLQVCSVVLLDIVDFKSFNHRYGYERGDQILQKIAQYLADNHALYQSYRLEGNQFALILKNSNKERSSVILNGIRERMKHTWTIGHVEHKVKFHYGMVIYPTHVKDAKSAVHALTFTITEAKKSNTYEVTLFDEKLMKKKETTNQLKEMLQDCIESEHVVVHYQPVYDLTTMKIVHVEALVRIFDHTHSLVYPTEFISLAEETGLIVQLTDLVVKHVCMMIKKLENISHNVEKVAINFSVLSMMQSDIEDRLFSIIDEFEIDPSMIEIELTESAMIESYTDIQEKISSLSIRGVTFALDDLGKGFSNIKRLISFPFHIVKLDKDILYFGVERTYFLEAIVHTLHLFGKKIVAEGVETTQQLQLCKDLGVDYAQGFLLSEPLEEEALFTRLTTQ